MNPEKAREHFSAYYEGTLEKGLSETLERALKTDAQVQAEYRSFVKLMEGLALLKDQPVPEPEEDLHEIIARRLDRQAYEDKHRAKAPLSLLWKRLAVGGLAAAALATAIFQYQSMGSTSMAGLGNVGGDLDKIGLRSSDKGYSIAYQAKEPTLIQIVAADGAILRQELAGNKPLSIPLANPNDNAKLLQIQVQGQSSQTFVALPGTRMQTARTGEGGIKDLALALAGFYRSPVLLSLGDEVRVNWQFGVEESVLAAQRALGSTSYSAQKNPDGVISIHPN